MPLLFLSHSGADIEDARELKRRLEASPDAREAGLKVWFDKDDLRPGHGWQEQLEDIIRTTSTAFAVYVGSKGVVNWVDSEVRLGLSRAVGSDYPFIPILAAASSSALPPFAAQYHGIRDPLSNADEMAKLLDAVLGKGTAAAPAAVIDDPYVGLRAMSEAEADRFFGRADDLGELIDKLRQSRLVAVDADSGAGKSSLVLAGLIPKFRGGVFRDPSGLEPDDRTWHVVVMRPGSLPFESLQMAVTTAAERLALTPVEKAQLRSLIDPSRPREIAYALQCNLPAETTETLLVVDQFEELFTQTAEDERQPFVDWLMSLVDPEGSPGFRVVVTIRNDYFNLLSAHPVLFDRVSPDIARLRLKRVPDAGIAEIVHEPLKLAGHRNEAERRALVDLVTRDVSDRPGDLALIQMALFETWNRRNDHGGDLVQSYVAVGGVAGALANAAETVRTRKLDDSERERLESVLVRLVTLGETGGVTRRRARLDEFDDDRQALIRKLADREHSRLLLTSEEAVEVCHEQLLTQWPWWQNCMNRNASDVRLLDRLIGKAGEWGAADAADRDKFLATGADLEEFSGLLDTHPDWLSALERDYVDAGQAAVEADRAAREQARIALEESAARRKRLVQWLAVAAGLLLVVAGAAGWFAADAVRQRNLAERNEIAAANAAREARENAEEANLQAKKALANESTALANESRALTALSSIALQEDRVNDAMKLALAAWPRSDSDKRPQLEAAPEVLSNAMRQGRPYAKEIAGVIAVDWELGRIVSRSEKALAVWDVETGKLVERPEHGGPLENVFFDRNSRNGDRFLTISTGGLLYLWDADTGRNVGADLSDGNAVKNPRFDADGSRILAWSTDDTLHLWDARSGRLVGRAEQHGGPEWRLLLSANGNRIVSWSAAGELMLWDAETGRRIGGSMDHGERIDEVVFNEDGSRLLSLSRGWLRLWETATAQQVGPRMDVAASYAGLEGALFYKGGRRVLAWTGYGRGCSGCETFYSWDAHTGRPIGPTMQAYYKQIGRVRVDASGTVILSKAGMWDAETGDEIDPEQGYDQALTVRDDSDERGVVYWSEGGPAYLLHIETVRRIALALGDGESVAGAVFDNGERRLLYWTSDGTLRLWNIGSGEQIGPAMEHGAAIADTRFVGDGSRILSWSNDGILRLWDAETGLPIGRVMKHGSRIDRVLLDEDDNRILVATSSGTVRLWDATTARPIGGEMEAGGSIELLRFNKDGSRVLTTTSEGTVRLWDAATAGPVSSEVKGGGDLDHLLFSSDESRILTVTDERTLRLWDAASGRRIGRAMDHGGQVAGASFSPDDNLILSWSEDGALRLWHASTGLATGPTMRQGSSTTAASFTPEGKRILSQTRSGIVRLWDAVTGQPVGPAVGPDPVRAGLTSDGVGEFDFRIVDGEIQAWHPETGEPMNRPFGLHDRGASLGPDGRLGLAWVRGVGVLLWDVITGKEIKLDPPPDEHLLGAAFSPNGQRVFTWSDDVRFWDVASRQEVTGRPIRRRASTEPTASRDGHRVLVWDFEDLHIWDVDSGDEIGLVNEHDDQINGAIFNRDETRILSWSDDHTLRLWDANSGDPSGAVMMHDGPVVGAAFLRDGGRILSWSEDGTARLWNANDGRPVGAIMRHDGAVVGAAFSSDQSRLLTWSRDGTIRVWESANGAPVGGVMRHGVAKNVTNAVFDADASRVLAAIDGKALLFDVVTGQSIAPAAGDRVARAVFSEDGKRAVLWSDDPTIVVWDINWPNTSNLFEVACRLLPEHDLDDLNRSTGVSISDPICADGTSIPNPDWETVVLEPNN